MFIKRTSRIAAMTLVEVMMAVGVFGIAGAAMSTAYVFSLRSFQALSNYSLLDEQNREAMDKLSKEIRQANSVDSAANGTISTLKLVVGTKAGGLNTNVTYKFDSTYKEMTRTVSYGSTILKQETMLKDCTLVNFQLGKRAPESNYKYENTTDANVAKLVDLTWKTSRPVSGGVVNTENIQTAKIVIRKQKLSQ